LCLNAQACTFQEEDIEDNESAAFGRMLATHNQNVQHRVRPLDDADDSFAGVSLAHSNVKPEFQTLL